MSHSVLVVGLGSNIKPHEHLRKALHALKALPDCRVLNVARIYESDPELPMQRAVYSAEIWNHQYLNSAVLLEVKNFEPQQFLKSLKSIETILGRKPKSEAPRWAPREIDLDILYVDGLIANLDNLIIPHERLTSRPFALLPLLEIFPQEKLNLDLPSWSQQKWLSEKPFNTKVSTKYFWCEIMGILNLTTDSFSDGQQNNTEQKFKSNARKLLSSGATILDLGAESTRPLIAGEIRQENSVMESETLRSALIWLSELQPDFPDMKVSIDTRHAEVIKTLLSHFKIDFINDVTGFRDPQMRSIAAESEGRNIAMHSLSVPVVKNETIDKKLNPIQVLNSWWTVKYDELTRSGISPDRIVFDPGIGFGKSAEQNRYILEHLHLLDSRGCEVLIGHSRKSFLQTLSQKPAAERDPETALVTASLNKAYYNYLRVHDIDSTKSALTI